jgi:putative ABC transport system permease protein
METLFQDVRYACRQLIRTPAFSIAAIVALALGIGANVTIFSTVNAVLLNSLPFRFIKNPQRLVSLYSFNRSLADFSRLPSSFKNFLAWKEQSHSFIGMEAYRSVPLNLTSNDGREPEQVAAVTVTPGFLPLLGIVPRMGRNFSNSETISGSDHVALISDELWRGRFNADSKIVGKVIRVSNSQYQIIGVMPARFELPTTDENKPKLWIPLYLHSNEDEGSGLSVIARLKPNVTFEQARAELQVIGNRLEKDRRENQGWGVSVFPTISEGVDNDFRTSLYVLQVAVGFVLLIACANVANLLLTRAVAREKEMAVRVAIGAGRWRIVRQNLTESLVLSFAGGALGLLLSLAGMRTIAYLAPKDEHGLHELTLNSLVLAFTLGVTVLSGILFGLAPSIHALRQSVAEALSRGSRSVSGSSRRFRSGLVVVEIAMSLILLVGAGLTIRSLISLLNVDPGFRPDHLLTMGLVLPPYQYQNPQQIGAFNDQLLARVQHLPGVQAASLSTGLPMRRFSESNYTFPGVAIDPNHLRITAWTRVTDQNVQAMGLHLLQGRNLTRADVETAKPSVTIVNEAFARSNWPNQNALGKVIVFSGDGRENLNYKIVGVVSNAHQMGPDSESRIEVYIPDHQMQTMSLLVRIAGDPLAMANSVKQQVWALDKDQPVLDVDSMENMLSEWVAPRRFTMTIMLAFGVIALLSAAVGLYSVLAYAVTLRTREIGVRVALGAEPKRVAAMILSEGVSMAVVGIVLGLAGAFALTRFMQSLIFGISAFDATTFILVSALLTVIAMIASYLPARRASLVNPTEALRAE